MNSMKYIQIVYKAYDSYLNMIASDYDMSATELKILIFLDESNGYDLAKDIVNTLMIAKSYASTSISSLVNKNYLKKIQDVNDKKKYHLKLTKEGYGIIHAIDNQLESFRSKLEKGITDTEMDFAKMTLIKVANNVKELTGTRE